VGSKFSGRIGSPTPSATAREEAELSEPDFRAQFERDLPVSRPYSLPPHPHLWLRYPSGGKGWSICKWCALTRSPEERALAERRA
jgi:hypothetical protein